jgi:hypothetical protein
MKKLLAFVALVGGLTAFAAVPAMAAPPDLPDDNPNPNAFILPVQCDGYNDDLPFLIWVPDGSGFVNGGAGAVGIPIGVDVPVGVQKVEVQGHAFDRAIPCTAPDGLVYVMPTGKPL